MLLVTITYDIAVYFLSTDLMVEGIFGMSRENYRHPKYQLLLIKESFLIYQLLYEIQSIQWDHWMFDLIQHIRTISEVVLNTLYAAQRQWQDPKRPANAEQKQKMGLWPWYGTKHAAGYKYIRPRWTVECTDDEKLSKEDRARKQSQERECNKKFDELNGKSAMMIFRCAKHGICVGRHMIKKGEGVNDIFSPIWCCWEEPPNKMISDFMCRCMPYCMQRDVNRFKHVLGKLDELHGQENHVACSCCFSMKIVKDRCPDWRQCNDQVCEQRNKNLGRFKVKGTWSRLENFMLMTELMFAIDNRILLQSYLPPGYKREGSGRVQGNWFDELQRLQRSV